MQPWTKLIAVLIALSVSVAEAQTCDVPAWPPAEASGQQPGVTQVQDDFAIDFGYRERVSEFVRCNRRTLPRRAAGLDAARVTGLVHEARLQEDLLIARSIALYGCMLIYREAPSTVEGKKKCDEWSALLMAQRRPPRDTGALRVISQRRFVAFGGAWSYGVEEYEARSCSHGPCATDFGLSITNDTPFELTCRASLWAQPSDTRSESTRVEQTAVVAPGYTVAAARVHISLFGDPVADANVTCEPKRWQDPIVRDHCTLQWIRSPGQPYPESLRRAWVSGAALVELTVRGRGNPVDLTVLDDNSNEAIGRAATQTLADLRMSTNCPDTRFRVRIEFHTPACAQCFERGSISLFRD